MPVSRISRKRVVVTLPASAYQQIAFLAKKKETTPTGYARHIVLRHLEEKNLPIYSFGSLPDNRGRP